MSINTDHACNAPEPEDPYAVIFWETCHRIEEDTEWLTAKPRTEFSLLHRYFGDHARRLKDLLEYQGILCECLQYLDNPGIQVTDRIPSYGLPDSLVEPSPEKLFEEMVSEIIKENSRWLDYTPRTLFDIVTSLFPGGFSCAQSRRDLYCEVAFSLWDQGFQVARKEDDSDYYWLKSKMASFVEIEPSKVVPPPLFIRREAPPVIYKEENHYQSSIYVTPLPEEEAW